MRDEQENSEMLKKYCTKSRRRPGLGDRTLVASAYARAVSGLGHAVAPFLGIITFILPNLDTCCVLLFKDYRHISAWTRISSNDLIEGSNSSCAKVSELKNPFLLSLVLSLYCECLFLGSVSPVKSASTAR